MAFVFAPSFTPRLSTSRRAVSRRPVFMSASPQPGTSKTETETSYTIGDNGYELDTDALQKKAMEVVNDVGARPLFYGKIAGYALGAIVSFTVLKAIVVAVDSIPVLPGLLELIGLGYTAWFVWRYVLFKESREELLEEIEEFLGRAKPGPQ